MYKCTFYVVVVPTHTRTVLLNFFSPTGTRIAFSTLADRPSAEDFEHSPVLQDWVTATDIKIVFPAPAEQEDNAISPAFPTTTTTSAATSTATTAASSGATGRVVGISDLAIGGRCKCNGHASDCTLDPATGDMACKCKHNTAGKECEKCKGDAKLLLLHQCII